MTLIVTRSRAPQRWPTVTRKYRKGSSIGKPAVSESQQYRSAGGAGRRQRQIDQVCGGIVVDAAVVDGSTTVTDEASRGS